MNILINGEKIQIVAKNEDIIKNKKVFYVVYQNRLYETTESFKCISPGHEDKYLYTSLRGEFLDLKDEAEIEFDRLNILLNPKRPERNFGSALEDMMLKVLAEQSQEKIFEIAKPMLDNHIKETYGELPQKFEVKTPKTTFEGDGVTHEKFEDVLNLVNLDIPVYLEGPAGTGKNVICKQVAESLGLEFYFTNAVTQEYKLTGFIDANGNYQETQFYKAFKNGGLFFLDEMDASIPEVLIILNAALANKYFDFPNGKIEAHKDFRVIAAGNTLGTGATNEYVGRYQLDEASLDRFALIHIDYSPKIENYLAQGDSELLNFVREFRKATNQAGIYCICSYRTIERIKKLEGLFEVKEILKMSLLKSLNKDDIQTIKYNINDDSKYTKALAA